MFFFRHAQLYRSLFSHFRSVGGTRGTHRPNPVDLGLVGPDGKHVGLQEFCDRFPRALLIGPAGTGKSTLLEQLAFRMAERFLASPETEPCPVFLSPADVPDLFGKVDFFVSLAEKLSAGVGETIRADAIRQKFDDGSIYLISDALDEVPGFDGVARLTDLYRQFPKLPGIVASRPIALTANLSNFPLISMRRFELGEIESLAKNRWYGRTELARDFLMQIEGRPTLAPLLENPLTASMCMEVFERRGRLPEARAEIFEAFVEQTIDWEFSRLVRPVLSRGEQLSIYGTFAEFLAQKNVGHASTRELRHLIESVIGEPPADDLYDRELSGGFLSQIAQDEWSFEHRSFQEYFLAWYHRDDPSYFVNAIRRGESKLLVEFGSHLVGDAAPIIEAALAAGLLSDAVAYLQAIRTENPALEEYVTKHFHNALGTAFIKRLAASSQVHRNSKREIHAVLLDSLDAAENSATAYQRGVAFERLCKDLFAQVFKVTVERSMLENGEVDLVLENVITDPYWTEYGGEFLVECKNLSGSSPVSEVNEFIGKLGNLRIKLAFMVSMNGFTDYADNAFAQQSSNPRVPLIVPITGFQIRRALQIRKSPEAFFKECIYEIKFRSRNRGR